MLQIVVLVLGLAFAPLAAAQAESYVASARPAGPGFVLGFASDMLRLGGSATSLADYTVGALISVRHAAGVDQWAFGIASEAWARPGARSVLVGVEAAVVNEEPGNAYPKIASSAVFKNRSDVAPQVDVPMNANSIAYWVSAQPGTGFERGLAFDRHSLLAVGRRPAAIDLSDLPDDVIGAIDLIRIRKDVALRYDTATRQLVLHVEPRAAEPR
jgi:hypothetical protein